MTYLFEKSQHVCMADFKDILKARFLRQVETKVEQILWEKLRNNKSGIKFRRQHPIGPFVVDFYAPKIKLVVELDGSHHAKHETQDYDAMRSQFLVSKTITVLRFWNSEVEKDLPSVLQKIQEKAAQLS